jgi:hypothetical protein
VLLDDHATDSPRPVPLPTSLVVKNGSKIFGQLVRCRPVVVDLEDHWFLIVVPRRTTSVPRPLAALPARR